MSPHLSPPSRSARPGEAGIDVAAALAAWVAGVDRLALFGASRGGAQVAAARQLAIYLAHVALGYELTRLAAAFGRDRATLRHALRRIEDERDDPAFDRQLTGLEAILMPLRRERVTVGGRCR
ncbi:helix-turn-helix domain-containing protein [Phreatobacter cathodiphilus]|uniref:Chromosomal replication initiator DnaA n=1 Tax=Phreatobacter cathodiphilus TaxID=1868589 RepID=A0A2S0N7M8_9HYPH|nr:helix-turn-helix domain-containing protein [Phreatobacter cathodiphilus]AVO44017.1 chromosomal replication initiator DnaA [Phreatobacter cathodiphilus]